MENIFLEVLRLSILSGVMVLAVLLIRLFLKRMPKSLCCLLWMLVGIRLVIPFSIESVFGLFPEGAILEQKVLETQLFESGTEKNGGIPGSSQIVSAQGEQERLPAWFGDTSPEKRPAASRQERFQEALRIGSWIWCVGVLLMSAYFMYSWFKIKACVRGAEQAVYPLESGKVRKEVRVFWCGSIETPFLFGILDPEIYLPLHMDREDLPYIVGHELAHRRRGDHLVKPAAFFLLAVHWFNPFIWIAYKMLCKDMELACDEMVIRDMEVRERKAYSKALLNCSVWKEKAAAAPVAFGELSVKERIKNILNYRKPTVLVICLGVILGVALLFGFMTQRKMMDGQRILLTNEAGGETEEETAKDDVTHLDIKGLSEADATLAVQESGLNLMVDVDDGSSQAYVKAWADAFCDRDGKTLLSMCSEELSRILGEEEDLVDAEGGEVSFGWSSPWPWDRADDYWIMDVTDTTARVLYYAWTSDPHVTVWEENLTWHAEGERYVMDYSELIFRDNLCTGEEFYSAYPEGGISGSRMDYISNGAGEALNENAKANRDIYGPLFAPDTAACFLLNLLNNDEKVKIVVEEEGEGETQVSIEFILDHTQVHVTMVQPYGQDGIWIPQTWEE